MTLNQKALEVFQFFVKHQRALRYLICENHIGQVIISSDVMTDAVKSRNGCWYDRDDNQFGLPHEKIMLWGSKVMQKAIVKGIVKP